MNTRLGVLVGALALCIGCSGAQAPQIDARALARGTVAALAQAWDVVEPLCLDAETAGVIKPQGECAKVLLPVHDSIAEAANIVDTWDATQGQGLPCVLRSIVADLQGAELLLADAKVAVPDQQLVDDAFKLAEAFIPQCSAAP